MSYFNYLISIVLLSCAAGGCGLTYYQSDEIKQEAVKLDSDVVAFKAEKQAEIDKLNKTFQDTSEALFVRLVRLCNEQLDHERDLNSQVLADRAVIDPNKVLLPTLMHDSSMAFVNAQFAEILAVDQEISDARTQYAGSVKTLQAAMDQLTLIDTNLKQIINGPLQPDTKAILDYIEGGYDGVKAGIAAAKTAGTSAPNAPVPKTQ